MTWNYEPPHVMGNYVVDKGAEGVSLAWWDGEKWIEMWGSQIVKVYGWIDVPSHTEKVLEN